MIDSHLHLDDAKFDGVREQIITVAICPPLEKAHGLKRKISVFSPLWECTPTTPKVSTSILKKK